MSQCISILHSSLWLNNISLYGYITFCASIHQLMDIWVVSTLWLTWIKLLWTLLYKFLCGHTLSFLWVIYLGMELLRYNSMFKSLKTAKLFSIVAVPFYFPTSNTSDSVSLPAFGIVTIFYFSHFDRCVVVSHYGFNLHFPNS